MRRHLLSGPDLRSVTGAAILVLAGLLAVPMAGQSLERVIWLPDSMSAVVQPRLVAADPGHNLVFAAGSDRVVALDAATLVKRWVLRPEPGSTVRALYRAPVGEMLYCLAGARLDAIDVTTGTVAKRTGLPLPPDSICPGPFGDKLYIFDTGRTTVLVFDCGSGTAVASVTLPARADLIRASRATNRVYAAASNYLVAIDCVTDSIVASIPGLRTARALASSPDGARMYHLSSSSDLLSVIDCRTDSIAGQVQIRSNARSLCVSNRTGTVYCGEYSGNDVYVIDPESLLVRHVVDVQRDPRILVEHPETGDVFAFCGTTNTTLFRIGADSATATGPFALPGYVRAAVWFGSMLVAVVSDNNLVCAVDPSGVVIGRTALGFGPGPVAVSRATGQCAVRLACLDSLAVLDEPDGRLRWLCRAGYGLGATGYSSTGMRLYWSSAGSDFGTFNAYDLAGDSLVLSLLWPYLEPDAGFNGLLANPLTRATYLWSDGGYGNFAVVDEVHDGVTTLLSLPFSTVYAVTADPAGDRVFIGGDDEYVLVLDAATGALRDVLGGLQSSVLAIGCDTLLNRIACITSNGNAVLLDRLTGEVRIAFTATLGDVGPAGYDADVHRFFVAVGESLVVADCAAGSIVASVSCRGTIDRVVCDPERGLVYVLAGDSLLAVDVTECRAVGSAPAPRGTRWLAVNAAYDRLLVSNYDECWLGVYTRPAAHGDGAASGRLVLAPLARRELIVDGQESVVLVNAAGRLAARLEPGSNDVSRLPAGVYFGLGRRTGLTRKVVLVR